MDVRVQDLRYFVTVAEELSFTRAAEALFVSQPALSKQIGRLETALRVKLFERERRAVTLTPAGHALLPRAREVIGAWTAGQREVAEAAARERDTLTIGFHTSIGRGLVPGTTARMREVLPGWRLLFRQVSWQDPTGGLGSGETDVAVLWLPAPAGYEHKVVSTEDRWVGLPRGHRLAGLDVVPFGELADEPFVALPGSAGPMRDFWLAAEQRTGPARVAVEVETAEEAFEAVAAGTGIMLVAEGNAEVYRRDDVVTRPVSGLPPAELAVLWHEGDSREAVRVFTDACRRCLCDRPSPGAR
ncbi:MULTISPECIES: LysR family transcriptional regulator [Amycolatopsis]|uniref:LysR family transcriptional regulator n=1 Tax=Amycolatopsis dongchuanensis TaxID=1070866 RepID=A0ABP8VRN0_9PSEU